MTNQEYEDQQAFLAAQRDTRTVLPGTLGQHESRFREEVRNVLEVGPLTRDYEILKELERLKKLDGINPVSGRKLVDA